MINILHCITNLNIMTLHFLNFNPLLHNGVVNGAESTQKINHYVIFASLKSDQLGKLINRIPLISSLPGYSSRMLAKSLRNPEMSTSILEDLPSKLDIKRHPPSILYSYSRGLVNMQQCNIHERQLIRLNTVPCSSH